ncbi:hypothetical protein GUJ93_ZPchr0009g578 [Zizania palustris]|uniref:Uncharacterized protein n=1 Tax=Zizania palustris TaxID=103762 RepID=A0A8J5VLB6_ZIZPA|nr:hypothetical protein GUJ93_ZPchr0009g578 [Zizania palustris]
MAEAPHDILTPKPHLRSTTLRRPSFVQGLRMKHFMSTPSQRLFPSTLLDEPHPDHAFDAPRLLRPSSGDLRVSPSGAHFELLASAEDLNHQLRSHSIRSTFEVPHLRGLVSEYLQPEPRFALSAFTWHASTRGPTRTTFAATVTELPAPLASSHPLDPSSPGSNPVRRLRSPCAPPTSKQVYPVLRRPLRVSNLRYTLRCTAQSTEANGTNPVIVYCRTPPTGTLRCTAAASKHRTPFGETPPNTLRRYHLRSPFGALSTDGQGRSSQRKSKESIHNSCMIGRGADGDKSNKWLQIHPESAG